MRINKFDSGLQVEVYEEDGGAVIIKDNGVEVVRWSGVELEDESWRAAATQTALLAASDPVKFRRQIWHSQLGDDFNPDVYRTHLPFHLPSRGYLRARSGASWYEKAWKRQVHTVTVFGQGELEAPLWEFDDAWHIMNYCAEQCGYVVRPNFENKFLICNGDSTVIVKYDHTGWALMDIVKVKKGE